MSLTVSLTDYRPYLPGMAGVLLLDIPPGRRGPGLLLHRYSFLLYCSDEERSELRARLSAGGTLAAAMAAWQKLPAPETDRLCCALLAPPMPGLPHLVLCHWPRDLAEVTQEDPDDFNRGTYTLEAFATLDEATDYVAWLASQFPAQRCRLFYPATGAGGEGRAAT